MTLQGRVVPIDDNDELLSLKTAFAVQHAGSERLLESPRFTLSKIQIERVYYVGGFGVSSEWVDVGAYSLATPDMLASESASLVTKLNSPQQRDDLDLLCTQFLKIDDAADGDVRVQSVDRLGLDVRVTYDRQQRRTKQFRIGFQSKVTSLEDAKSEIAKHHAGGRARGYWGEDRMGPRFCSGHTEELESRVAVPWGCAFLPCARVYPLERPPLLRLLLLQPPPALVFPPLSSAPFSASCGARLFSSTAFCTRIADTFSRNSQSTSSAASSSPATPPATERRVRANLDEAVRVERRGSAPRCFAGRREGPSLSARWRLGRASPAARTEKTRALALLPLPFPARRGAARTADTGNLRATRASRRPTC